MRIFSLTLLLCITKLAVSQKENPDTERCFDIIGCFNNKGAFQEIGLFVENNPERIKTEFLLFTSSSQDQAQSISYKDIDTIRESGFNSNLPLKVIIHGYANDLNNVNTDWMRQMKSELFIVRTEKLSLKFRLSA